MYKWSFQYKQGYENFPIFFRPQKEEKKKKSLMIWVSFNFFL